MQQFDVLLLLDLTGWMHFSLYIFVLRRFLHQLAQLENGLQAKL